MVPVPPEPEQPVKENATPISPKLREPVRPLFEAGNLDHRKIQAAIHMHIRYGTQARIGARIPNGVVIMPRRHWPELTGEDLAKLKELDLSSEGLSDLAPLAGLTGTTSIYLNNNPVPDIAPLSGLTGLLALQLNQCQIINLTPLRNLKGLGYLNLNNNQVSDLAPLAGLRELELIGLSGNQVSDLAPLAGFKKLYHLELMDNRITDLAPLADLKSLKYLSLDQNPGLTQAEIDKLQRALPNCEISHNASQ